MTVLSFKEFDVIVITKSISLRYVKDLRPNQLN